MELQQLRHALEISGRNFMKLSVLEGVWPEILRLTSFLDQVYPKVLPRQRFLHVDSGMFALTMCPGCGVTPANFYKGRSEYTACSTVCRTKLTRQTVEAVYGVTSVAKLPEVRRANSEANKISRAGNESKRAATCIERFGIPSHNKHKRGDDNPARRQEVKDKMKATSLERYGVDNYWKTDEFKQKTRETNLKKYGTDWASKSSEIKDKCRATKISMGIQVSDEDLDAYKRYRRQVLAITKRNKPDLLAAWDGADYYDGEDIREYASLHHDDKLYPTVDHKMPIFRGFLIDLPPEIIGDLDNLCITKRFLNDQKNTKTEMEFRFSLEPFSS